MLNFDLNKVKTPCYVIDAALIEKNLKILKYVSDASGCKILLAQKAFSLYGFYPLISKYLSGSTSSGINEARLAHKYFKGERHIFAPAYKDTDIKRILKYCDHIVFNSIAQWKKFKDKVLKANKSCGIRINPQFSTQGGGLYDPCARYSRMGVTLSAFDEFEPDGLQGLHIHTLCEQGADDLIATLEVFERDFSKYFNKLKWLNFGGGHHITKPGYDVEKLIGTIKRFKEKYNLEIYLEPGEAVVMNSGFLVSTVIEKVKNEMEILLLDASAACHMPDVLEMPYRPPVLGGYALSEKAHNYRLGSLTCLAGDIAGDYSFEKEIEIGDKVVFCDMALYTIVKNNTFNGINLPYIYWAEGSKTKLYKKFGYKDFKSRL